MDCTAVVITMFFTRFTYRLVWICFTFLASESGLAVAFALALFKSRLEYLDLPKQHVNNLLLLFKEKLAVPAVGGDLENVRVRQLPLILPSSRKCLFFPASKHGNCKHQ